MKGTSWAILVILILLGIWYFGFYNDKYESPENRDETEELEASVEDLLNADFEITREDDQNEFYFTPTSKFSLFAPDGEDDLSFDCEPEGSIKRVTTDPDAPAGQRGFAFEAIAPGSCRVEVGDWVTTVNILEEPKG
jgi:hypothetical protein